MLNKLFLTTAVIALSVGCTSDKSPQIVVHSPEVTAPAKEITIPLTEKFQEINSGNWHFLAPSSFKDITKEVLNKVPTEDKNVVNAVLHSSELHISIIAGSMPSKRDLVGFATDFGGSLVSNGFSIKSIRQSSPGKGMSGLDTIMFVFSNESDSHIEFVTVDKEMAYMFDCNTRLDLKDMFPVCMTVVNSVKIKN